MSSKLTNLALVLALTTVATSSQAMAADRANDDANLNPQMKKAKDFHRQGKFKEASDAYREVIRLEPNNAPAHQSLGAVLAGLGTIAPDEKTRKDLDETAILEEKQAIKLDPKFHLPHIVLGQIYANQGKFEEAIKEFKTAAELKPDSFSTQIDLGQIYLKTGALDDALKAYRRATEIKPDKATAYINMGVVQQNLGDYPAAIESELKGISLQKNPYELQAASLNLANVYADSGESDKAIKYYQDAYKLNPNDVMPLSGIGWMQSAKGDYVTAIATQRKVIKQAGKNQIVESIARARMATALSRKGDTAEAEKEFQKVMITKPLHPVAVMEYGYYLEKAGRKSEAKSQFEKALTIQPTFKPAKEALAKLDSSKSDTK
ncbi:MAG: tetratricopeptide repeat protein [Candidatus Melainabacteria bacterium]|nr:tetratricopeptide repeat protein [Candidatus Melainabacteria bacterium]